MSTEAPESLGILDGVCTNGNAHFWIYFIGSIAMTLLILYCRHRLVTPPTFHPSRSKADVGLPFDLAMLVYHICLWCIAPQVTLFLMYHVITTDVFSKQTYLACITLSGVPVIVVVLFTQATAILLMYRPDWIRVDVASEVVPVEYGVATANRVVKILFLGCTGHGMLLVDCLEKERNGSNVFVEAHMVDFAHASGSAFVKYNAACAGVQEKLADRFHRSIWVGTNKYNLPFDDGVFDKVILSPNVRNVAPIGELMTGDDEKIPRMVRMLHEAMRVLRADGELIGCDLGASVVPLWADLRDAGFTATLTETGKVSGPVPFMKSKLLKLHCPHQSPPAPLAPGAAAVPLISTAPAGDTGAVSPAHGDLSSVTQMDVLSEVHLHNAISETTKLRAVVLLQCSVFVILTMLAMAIFDPLSVPTSIPISTRFSTVVAGIATGYPMMGFFSREATMSSETPFSTIQSLLLFCVRREGIALLVSTGFTVVLGIPGFLLQVALSSSSLSVGARSQIGMIISVALGFGIFMRASALHRTRIIAQRHIPDEYAIYL
jgi:hypothetical protein